EVDLALRGARRIVGAGLVEVGDASLELLARGVELVDIDEGLAVEDAGVRGLGCGCATALGEHLERERALARGLVATGQRQQRGGTFDRDLRGRERRLSGLLGERRAPAIDQGERAVVGVVAVVRERERAQGASERGRARELLVAIELVERGLQQRGGFARA